MHVLTIGHNKILFEPAKGLNYRPKRGMIGRGIENNLVLYDEHIEKLHERAGELTNQLKELENKKKKYEQYAEIPDDISDLYEGINKPMSSIDEAKFTSKTDNNEAFKKLKQYVGEKSSRKQLNKVAVNEFYDMITPRRQKLLNYEEREKEKLEKSALIAEKEKKILNIKKRDLEQNKTRAKHLIEVLKQNARENKEKESKALKHYKKNIQKHIIEGLKQNARENKEERQANLKRLEEIQERQERQEITPIHPGQILANIESQKITMERLKRNLRDIEATKKIKLSRMKKAFEAYKQESSLDNPLKYKVMIMVLKNNLNEELVSKLLQLKNENANNPLIEEFNDYISEAIENKENLLKYNEIKKSLRYKRGQQELRNINEQEIAKIEKQQKDLIKSLQKSSHDDKDYFYETMLRFRPSEVLSSELPISQTLALMNEKWNITKSRLEASTDKGDKELLKLYNQREYEGLRDLQKMQGIGNGQIAPPELSRFSIEEEKEETEAKGNVIFEERFKDVELVRKFLIHTRACGLTEAQLRDAEIYIIETGSNYSSKLKLTEKGFPFDSYKKDKNFPIDILVNIRLKDGTIKKVGIELKYYNANKMWTGLNLGERTAPVKTGDALSYKEMLEIQHTFFNNYKNLVIQDIIKNKEKIEDKEKRKTNSRTSPEDKAKLTVEIEELKTKVELNKEALQDQQELTRRFNSEVYGVFHTMKVSKVGYKFKQNLTKEEMGVNEALFYENLKKYQTSPRMLFNSDGVVYDTYQPKSEQQASTRAPWINGREILFCISYYDAVTACNYSDLIRRRIIDPENVFKNLRIAKTAYAAIESDSLAIPLEYFSVFGEKIQPPPPPPPPDDDDDDDDDDLVPSRLKTKKTKKVTKSKSRKI